MIEPIRKGYMTALCFKSEHAAGEWAVLVIDSKERQSWYRLDAENAYQAAETAINRECILKGAKRMAGLA